MLFWSAVEQSVHSDLTRGQLCVVVSNSHAAKSASSLVSIHCGELVSIKICDALLKPEG